jgi:hypothetical protein
MLASDLKKGQYRELNTEIFEILGSEEENFQQIKSCPIIISSKTDLDKLDFSLEGF